MKRGLGYAPAEAAFPFSGTNLVKASTQLAPGESPYNLNAMTFRGSLQKRTGYSALGNTGFSGNAVLQVYNFQDGSGTNHTVAFTTTKVWAYNGSTWTDITGSMTLTGTEDTFIDVTSGVDTNLGRVMVATNGTQAPFYWTGTGNIVALTVNLPGFVSAKTCAVFNGYLVLANITTATDHEPRTAAWSDTGVFTEWLSGNSGVLAEMNFDGEILRLIPYAQNLIVFSRHTIGCLCYIDSEVIFGSQIYVTDVSVVGPKAICNVHPFLMYVGQDNLYLWDGGRAVAAIGDKIATKWRSEQVNSYIGRTGLFYDQSTSRVMWWYYTSATAFHMFMSELALSSFSFADTERGEKTRWFEWTPYDRPICFGHYSDSSNYQSVIMGSAAGVVVKYDTTYTDRGTAILFYWDTPDLSIPEVFQSQVARWIELEVEAIGGGTLNTAYSSNQGSSFTSTTSLSLTSSLTRQLVPFDVTARTLRFRFTDVGSTYLTLSWYRAWMRPGGAR